MSLNLYAVDYDLEDDNTVPTRDDYVALEAATADFFEKFMKDNHYDPSASTLNRY